MEKKVEIDIMKQVVKAGPSLAIIIPKDICTEHNIIKGDFVEGKITKIIYVKKR